MINIVNSNLVEVVMLPLWDPEVEEVNDLD